MEEVEETHKTYFEMSGVEMMKELAGLIKDNSPLSQATISGMFRQMSEEYFHRGLSPQIAKDKAQKCVTSLCISFR